MNRRECLGVIAAAPLAAAMSFAPVHSPDYDDFHVTIAGVWQRFQFRQRQCTDGLWRAPQMRWAHEHHMEYVATKGIHSSLATIRCNVCGWTFKSSDREALAVAYAAHV